MNYKLKQRQHLKQAFGCMRCGKPFVVSRTWTKTRFMRSTPAPIQALCGECPGELGDVGRNKAKKIFAAKRKAERREYRNKVIRPRASKKALSKIFNIASGHMFAEFNRKPMGIFNER